MIRDQQAATPGKPFFAYLAFGACHSPQQAPREYIDRYRGRFDDGWDEVRERWFARQLELGIVPPGTRLSPLDEDVRSWRSLDADERRLCARHQEVFAGFLDHTDAQVGRLVDYLESRDMLDNTLLVVLSDNGATAEGGELGDVNIRRHYQFLDEPFEQKLAGIDRLGSEFLWSNYPRGWGHAGNTPLKRFKMHTHGGGIRDPLILHWPARITRGGLVSPQFCHCADIVPTVLEALQIEAPKVVQGIEQLPIHGTSLCYTFDEPLTPARTRIQYFELMGNRGLWADGWKAVTRHAKGADYETERWELYHVDDDFAETVDLADQHPARLRELIALWWGEARRNDVLPLDDRDRERILLTYWDRPRRHWSYEQGMNRVSGYAAPSLGNRSYHIDADVELAADTEGVILAIGGKAGGEVLFVQEGRLVYEYVGPEQTWVIRSLRRLQPGRHRLVMEFFKTADCAGTATLLCDGEPVGSLLMKGMWPMGATSGGVFCGYDDASVVSERYQAPFNFSGRIHGVTVETGDAPLFDRALHNHVSIAED